MKTSNNRVMFSILTVFFLFGAKESNAQWEVMYKANVLPSAASPVWGRVGGQSQNISDGVLTITDDSYSDLIYYTRSWSAENNTGFTVEAKVKNINGNNQAVCIMLWDDKKNEHLYIEEDRISLAFSGLDYEMDTQDDFHTYRITAKDDDIMVYVDGVLRICGKDAYNKEIAAGRIWFGSQANSTTGSSEWDYLRYSTSGVYPSPGYMPNECLLSAEIDIKPGSATNSINLNSAGVIPVAILSSNVFDPTTIDPETVSLAGAKVKIIGKSGKYLCHDDEDINEDGLSDKVCQVYTEHFLIEPGESVAILEAETYEGVPIRGEDTVRIVQDN